MPRKPLTPEQIQERNELLARAREKAAQNRALRSSQNTETPAAQGESAIASQHEQTTEGLDTPHAQPATAKQPGESPPVEAVRVAPARPEAGGHDAPREPEHETLQQPAYGREALGKLAQALTGNPAVDEAFRRAVTETVQLWERTEPDERYKREDLYHEMRAIRALKHQIGRLAQEGRMAELRADRLKAV